MSIFSGILSLIIFVLVGWVAGSRLGEIWRDPLMRSFNFMIIGFLGVGVVLALHDNKMTHMISTFRQPFGVTDSYIIGLILGGSFIIGGILGFYEDRIKSLLCSFCSSQEAES